MTNILYLFTQLNHILELKSNKVFFQVLVLNSLSLRISILYSLLEINKGMRLLTGEIKIKLCFCLFKYCRMLLILRNSHG
jgi:hypothetical protein